MSRSTASPAAPLPVGLHGPGGFRTALADYVIPAVRRFRPEIIFISAGFDGLASDPLVSK
jgi:acetoin utilization deacetylase AcuC-like enzyme